MIVRVSQAFTGGSRSTELRTEPAPVLGLEAKKRSRHCPGGSEGTGRAQEVTLGSISPAASAAEKTLG